MKASACWRTSDHPAGVCRFPACPHPNWGSRLPLMRCDHDPLFRPFPLIAASAKKDGDCLDTLQIIEFIQSIRQRCLCSPWDFGCQAFDVDLPVALEPSELNPADTIGECLRGSPLFEHFRGSMEGRTAQGSVPEAWLAAHRHRVRISGHDPSGRCSGHPSSRGGGHRVGCPLDVDPRDIVRFQADSQRDIVATAPDQFGQESFMAGIRDLYVHRCPIWLLDP